MKKIIYIIILLIIIFIVNLLLYFFSDSYKDTIKSLKGDNLKVTDEYILDNLKKEEKKDFSFQEDKEKNGNNDFEEMKKQNNILNKKVKEKIEKRKDYLNSEMNQDKLKKSYNSKMDKKSFKEDLKQKTVSYSKKQKTYIDSIKWFFKGYKLKNNSKKDIIFRLTTEFPPERYLEYSSENLNLYFFIDTSYEKVLDIFDVLSYEDSFKINKTNTFGDKSFYLNRFKDDSYVRLVIKYKDFTFGLMVKKKYYNNIKSILKAKLR